MRISLSPSTSVFIPLDMTSSISSLWACVVSGIQSFACDWLNGEGRVEEMASRTPATSNDLIAQHGLSAEEYKKIVEILGREREILIQ